MRAVLRLVTTLVVVATLGVSHPVRADDPLLEECIHRRPTEVGSHGRLRSRLATLVPSLYVRLSRRLQTTRTFDGGTRNSIDVRGPERLVVTRSQGLEWEIGLRWNLLSAIDGDHWEDREERRDTKEAVEEICTDIAAARRHARTDDSLEDRLAEELAEQKLDALRTLR